MFSQSQIYTYVERFCWHNCDHCYHRLLPHVSIVNRRLQVILFNTCKLPSACDVVETKVNEDWPSLPSSTMPHLSVYGFSQASFGHSGWLTYIIDWNVHGSKPPRSRPPRDSCICILPSQLNDCIMPSDFEVSLMLTVKYRMYLLWSQLGSCHASSCIAYEASLHWEFRVLLTC
jgi:hypothetical protein